MTTQDTNREVSPGTAPQWSVVAHEEGQEPRTLASGLSEAAAKSYAKGFNRADVIEQKTSGKTIRVEAVQLCIDLPETNITNVERRELNNFRGKLADDNHRILADGVTVERYGLDACMYDEADNPKEETRGHIWRLIAEPDYQGYLDRDESLQLFVEILDIDQPVEKAAFKRIYAAAEEMQALARSIETDYVVATGDIGPVPEINLLDDCESRWGPEIVPNVRIKHNPKSYLIDDDGNEIEGSRGHVHSLEFNDSTMNECGGILALVDSIDDRDAPTINEAAAKRLLEASAQLHDAALQLAPHMAEQLSRLMVEITGPDQPRYVVAFKDPRVGFCENHNQRSTDGTTASIIERPNLADVPDMDFDQAKVKPIRPTPSNGPRP